jgi:hypothetical protein
LSLNFSLLFSLLDILTFEDGSIKFVTKHWWWITTAMLQISHKNALTWWFGDTNLGLVLHGPIYSDLVWQSSSALWTQI